MLAVAQEADRDATKPKVVNAVTLELTPRDAEMLDLARSVGTLSLVLRNQTDPKATQLGGGATKAELLGKAPEPEPAKIAVATPTPPVRRAMPRAALPVAAVQPAVLRNCVDVIRGVSKVTECF